MAKKDKQGKVEFTGENTEKVVYGTVKGYTLWAKAMQPDNFGNYSVSLYGKEVERLAEEMMGVLKDAQKELKEDLKIDANVVREPLVEVDNGGGGTEKCIRFKLQETKFDGTPNTIEFYNASGDKIDPVMIGNGSKVAVKYGYKPYFMNTDKSVGISSKFYAIAIIKLEEFNNSGFGDLTDDEDYQPLPETKTSNEKENSSDAKQEDDLPF
jgi:hypothetical protein